MTCSLLLDDYPDLMTEACLDQLFNPEEDASPLLFWQYTTDDVAFSYAGNTTTSFHVDEDLSFGVISHFQSTLSDVHKLSISQLDEMVEMAGELMSNPSDNEFINGELAAVLLKLKSIYQLVCYTALLRAKSVRKHMAVLLLQRWPGISRLAHRQLSHIMVGPVGSYVRNGGLRIMMDDTPSQLAERAIREGEFRRQKLNYQDGLLVASPDFPEKPSDALVQILTRLYEKTAEMQTHRGFAWGAQNDTYYRQATQDISHQIGIVLG